jgi:hypothetical protein
MAQQTAVEWLDRWFRDNPEATHEEGNKALEQAKQMEKEQIIDATCLGKYNNIDDRQKGEEYYNQTYNQNK